MEVNQQQSSNSLNFSSSDETVIIEESPCGRYKKFDDKIEGSRLIQTNRGYDCQTGCQIHWNCLSLKWLSAVQRKLVLRRMSLYCRLNSGGFAKCVGYWVDKRRLSLIYITELITSGPLSQYLLKIRPPKVKIIKSWCLQLLEALKYYYSADGMPPAYGRLRCEEIMMNSHTNELKLSCQGFVTEPIKTCWQANFGCPQWIPPEMSYGSVGMHTDVYCFGMVLIQILTMRKPYSESSNPSCTYRMILNQVLPPEIQDITNSQFKQIIIKCLSQENSRPTIDQLLQLPFWRETTYGDDTPMTPSEASSMQKQHSIRTGATSGSAQLSTNKEQIKKNQTLGQSPVSLTLEAEHIGAKSFKINADCNCDIEQLFEEMASFLEYKLSQHKQQRSAAPTTKSSKQIPPPSPYPFKKPAHNEIVQVLFLKMYTNYSNSLRMLLEKHNLSEQGQLRNRLRIEQELIKKIHDRITVDKLKTTESAVSPCSNRQSAERKSILIDRRQETCSNFSAITSEKNDTVLTSMTSKKLLSPQYAGVGQFPFHVERLSSFRKSSCDIQGEKTEAQQGSQQSFKLLYNVKGS